MLKRSIDRLCFDCSMKATGITYHQEYWVPFYYFLFLFFEKYTSNYDKNNLCSRKGTRHPTKKNGWRVVSWKSIVKEKLTSGTRLWNSFLFCKICSLFGEITSQWQTFALRRSNLMKVNLSEKVILSACIWVGSQTTYSNDRRCRKSESHLVGYNASKLKICVQ